MGGPIGLQRLVPRLQSLEPQPVAKGGIGQTGGQDQQGQRSETAQRGGAGLDSHQAGFVVGAGSAKNGRDGGTGEAPSRGSDGLL